MSRPVGSTLPPYDKLSEALLGLTLLALDRPRGEHKRLVEQFRAQYPEIILLEPGDVLRSPRPRALGTDNDRFVRGPRHA